VETRNKYDKDTCCSRELTLPWGTLVPVED
jgi:hypothetical protein